MRGELEDEVWLVGGLVVWVFVLICFVSLARGVRDRERVGREEVVCAIEWFGLGWGVVVGVGSLGGEGKESVQQGTHDGGRVRGVLGLLRNGGGRGVVRRKEATLRTGTGKGQGRARVRVVGLGICSWVLCATCLNLAGGCYWSGGREGGSE